MKQRSTFWNNFTGILMLLVVFGHFIYSYSSNHPSSFANELYIFIYSFHIPALAFCFGYFSRSEQARSKETLAQLALYYLVFNTLMMLAVKVLRDTALNFMEPYYSFWFLIALLVWRAVIGQLAKIKFLIPLSVLVALLIGFSPEFTAGLAVTQTIAFFPFFAAGFLINSEKLEKFIKNRKPWQMALYALPVLAVAAAGFWAVNRVDITHTIAMMPAYADTSTIIQRALLMVVAAAAIVGLLLVVPKRKIPLLTNIGRNFLLIYLLDRFISMAYYVVLFPAESYSTIYLVYALGAALATCAVLSIEKLNTLVSDLFRRAATAMIRPNSKKGRRLKSVLCLGFAALLLFNSIGGLKQIPRQLQDLMLPRQDKYLSAGQEAELNDAIKLAFVGDLLLLKDQITSAYVEETNSYDFSGVFEYAAPYLTEADLAIGVFEGPAAGDSTPYSTSNFGDGQPLYFNFPDDFAQAIKDAGIDLVTTATNHLMDRDLEGALRTLDVLDEVGLLHTGSYRNQEEKDELLIVEVDGVKIAVLSYVNNMNNHPINEFVDEYPSLTSVIPAKRLTTADESGDYTNPYFERLSAEIEEDFAQARESGADLIMVLPHMGTQFKHTTNNFQTYWNTTFAELGADIILGDHAHAVQPIEYIGDTLVVNCPGNFANSYIADNGDATAIVEVYISRDSKEVLGSSVIPMYTQEAENNYFRALPIYSILNDEDLYDELRNVDIERIKVVQELITEVMVGKAVPLENVQPRYYYINNQYVRESRILLKSAHDYSDRELYKLIDEAGSVTFIGDSITEGTKNEWHPWYEPMMEDFEGKTVVNVSKGGHTVSKLLDEFSEDILASKTDLYVVAIGCNDVRYRNQKICAMTAEDYVEVLDEMVDLILQSNPNAKIVFLPPWMTLDNDRYSNLSHEDKNAMTDEYGAALAAYAAENGYHFIDPNGYLRNFFANAGRKLYTSDGIHPNAGWGIELYSMAVLESSP